ncbi:hypothetical protein SLS62_000218 [Diatrype stigma]|uniref:LIM zinc-binding domain-containing protein n=1 Tax=Diatrype stigma TaxID=117547 RepID=A0AAN9V468_9PEZI
MSNPFTTTGTSRHSMASPSVRSETPTSHLRMHTDLPKQPTSNRRSVVGSVASRYSTISTGGRDYHYDDDDNNPPQSPLKPSEVVPSATYIERGQRWMEKEEVSSLRRAMDAMDLKDDPSSHRENDNDQAVEEDEDEKRLYNAALNEAAELVWRHEHGVKPPEPGTPYHYKPHLRKDSYAHARTASVKRGSGDFSNAGRAKSSLRSYSGSSSGSDEGTPSGTPRGSTDLPHNGSPESATKSNSYAGIGSAPRPSSRNHRRRSSMKRNISGEIEKPFSGDQIWEEPEGSAPEPPPKQSPSPTKTPSPLKSKPRNPLGRVQFAPAAEPETSPSGSPKRLSRFEIHRNPPTQSRNPSYRTNSPLPPSSASPSPSPAPAPAPAPAPIEEIPKKNGMEIRSDDIRQATSMRLKDRSAKLPMPSAVSDSPGRPIVSFDKNWKAPEEATDRTSEESSRVQLHNGLRKGGPGQQDTLPPVPSIAFTEAPEKAATPSPTRSSRKSGGPPAIPSINVDCDDDQYNKNSKNSPVSVPTIVLPGDDDSNSRSNSNASSPTKPSARPLPTPGAAARSPFGGRPRGHWSPDPHNSQPGRSTALCHECGQAIQGRFVALKGTSERFHPSCFRCYACGTGLEALEISPEPEASREARLDRIRRRAAGEILPETPGETMAEDGDDRLRFYCHLDWHELFAPRCRHCRTPILGEHVVALGGSHWHYGHFFCAECGDPFGRGDTHIEKDGYAWCVSCQTRRTERRAPKCRACKGPVIGQYVRALGGEWHDECFRCATCRGGFDDGQIFPMPDRGDGVVLCTGCRAAELKM